MKKLLSVLIALVLALGFALPALAEPDPVKIGVILPLSGSNSSQGAQSKRALEMALEEINASGGIQSLGGAKLQLIYADSESTPATAVSEAERLVNQEGVQIVTGAYHSAVTLAASEVTERYGVTWFAPVSSDDSITQREGYRYIFRMAEKTSWRAVAYLNYLEEMCAATGTEVKTIGLVYENTGYGQGAHNAWVRLVPEHGWEIVVDEAYDVNMTDASAVVNKIKEANADVILLATSGMPATLLLTAGLKQQQVSPKAYIATSAAQTDPDYLKNAQEDCLGVFDVGGWEIDVNRPYSADVAKKFQETYGVPLNNEGAKEYVGLYVIRDVMERAASYDREAIRDAFAATNITGDNVCQMYADTITFDEMGQFPFLSSIVLAQFRNVDGVIQRVTVYPEDQAREGFNYVFPYDYTSRLPDAK